MALGKARHFVEQQRRVAHLALINVDEAADLLFGFGPLDGLQLAGGLDALIQSRRSLLAIAIPHRFCAEKGADGLEFPPRRQLHFCPDLRPASRRRDIALGDSAGSLACMLLAMPDDIRGGDPMRPHAFRAPRCRADDLLKKAALTAGAARAAVRAYRRARRGAAQAGGHDARLDL